MKNKTILLITIAGAPGKLGKIEEVGDDYIVFRWLLVQEKKSWFSDDIEYRYPGTIASTIPFANLQIQPAPNMKWAEEKFREAELNE